MRFMHGFSVVFSFLITVFYCSLFEWWFHRYVLHGHFPLLGYGYYRHTKVHHGLYPANKNPEKDRFEHQGNGEPRDIKLQWYTLPILLLLHLPIFFLLKNHFMGWPVVFSVISAMVTYFVIYETFHYFMHAPRGCCVEKLGVFKYIRARHHLHHGSMRKNYCVLLPFADWLFKTGAWLFRVRFVWIGPYFFTTHLV